MNKEDSIKEKFKQALQSTYKVISDDYKVVKNKKNDEKVYDIGEIDNINDKNQFKKLRAETDSEALKRRFSNRKLLDKNNPQNPSCRTLYQLAEKVRYELLGSEMLKGISKNFKENYKNRLQHLKQDKITKKEDTNIVDAFEIYMTNKFFNVELYQENKEILKFWEKDFNKSINKHFEFLNQNLENQEVYNAKFSEILESMDIFENDDTTEKENEENDDTQDQNNSNNNEDKDNNDSSKTSEDENISQGMDSEDDVNEFRLEDQLGSENNEDAESENVIQKKNLSVSDKEYKIFTTEFDEVAKAESLDTAEEIQKLRKNLDQQLTSFQDLITKLANKLQRQLMAKQNRSWEFDLEEGLLDSSKLPRIIIDPYNSLIDLNRAGVPLLEIVTEPEIRSSFEAQSFVNEIRKIVKYLDICNVNMEEGSLRCDANVSVMKENDKDFGTKVEIKNMNSTRNIKKAIDFEIDRQIELIEQGKSIVQETRNFNALTNATNSMRTKEKADDYRYFTEPDLQPLILDEKYIQSIANDLPLLPNELERKFKKEFDLSSYDIKL